MWERDRGGTSTKSYYTPTEITGRHLDRSKPNTYLLFTASFVDTALVSTSYSGLYRLRVEQDGHVQPGVHRFVPSIHLISGASHLLL